MQLDQILRKSDRDDRPMRQAAPEDEPPAFVKKLAHKENFTSSYRNRVDSSCKFVTCLLAER